MWHWLSYYTYLIFNNFIGQQLLAMLATCCAGFTSGDTLMAVGDMHGASVGVPGRASRASRLWFTSFVFLHAHTIAHSNNHQITR